LNAEHFFTSAECFAKLSLLAEAKTPMPWTEIALLVPDFLKDAVTGELSEVGAAGLWEDEGPSTGGVRLVAYFENPPELDTLRTVLQPIFQREGLDLPELKSASVKDQDWGEQWKKHWASFPLGRRFFVVPSWSDSICPDDREPIYIDPGQAFGTGTHETTQLTLEAMEVWMEPRKIVLDLGTGSGILAIAAKLLGARAVHGCDTDPVAVAVARENFERNSAPSIGMMCGSIDAIAGKSVGFLLCNLTAEAISELLPDIQRAMRPQAIAVFSGLLTSQSRDIRLKAGPLGLIVLQERTRGEWCALVMRNNGP
jgi:ribosomal protein L11 methyltransferase